MQSISQVLAPCAWTFWEGWLTGDKGASLYILSESIICHKKKPCDIYDSEIHMGKYMSQY